MSKSKLSLNKLLSCRLQLNQLLRRALKPLSLTPQQACILFVLKHEDDPCQIEQLGGVMELSGHQINLLSFDLHDRGLVVRKAQRIDGGKKMITLEITEMGKLVIGAADQLEFLPRELPIGVGEVKDLLGTTPKATATKGRLSLPN